MSDFPDNLTQNTFGFHLWIPTLELLFGVQWVLHTKMCESQIWCQCLVEQLEECTSLALAACIWEYTS